MMKESKNITVFLASPADVADERQALEQVVSELNIVVGAEIGVRLELIRWETHAHPAIGSDAQAVINSQLPNDFDVFIGIFWSRVGSPTPRAISGTAEEFDRAIMRHRIAPGSIEIMLFFKDQPLSPNQIEPEQLTQLNEFKSAARDLGVLDRSFKGTNEFEKLARLSLARCMYQHVKRLGVEPARPATHVAPILEPPEHASTSDLDDPDLGFLDADEIALEAMTAFEVVANQMGDATTEMGRRISGRAKELEAVVGDVRASKKIVEQAASHTADFATTLEGLLPSLHANLDRALTATARGLTIRMADLNIEASHVVELFKVTALLEANMDGAARETRRMRETIANTPRATANFNRAKRRTVLVLDRILEEFALGKRLLAEVHRIIDQISR